MLAIASCRTCMILHVDGNERTDDATPGLTFLNEVAQRSSCPIQRVIASWIDKDKLTELFETLKDQARIDKRSTLLVAGRYLEEQVTLCVLQALAEGFDVHLLCDLLVANDRRLARTTQQRLVQAGAVPSSLRQFLYLWRSVESDADLASAFEEMLSRYGAEIRGASATRIGLS